MKKLLNAKLIFIFVFLTFITSLVYVSIRIVLAPAVAPYSEIAVRVKGDYVFMLLRCIFGIFAMLFPVFLEHKVNLKIPSAMLIIYAVFL